MKYRMTPRRATLLLAFLTLLFSVSFTRTSSAATPGVGWIRLANLSETLSPVDIYVVPQGSGTTIVKHDLSYGEVLTPLQLTAGKYTVDIRKAGAAASSPPAGSVAVTVAAGRFYTVAPINVTGKGNQRKVVDLPDSAPSPADDASVMAIDAAINAGPITFHCSYTTTADGNILTNAKGGTAESENDVPPGDWTMTATGSDGRTYSVKVPVAADTDRTEIVLDTINGVQILNELDLVGVNSKPHLVSTGLAPVPGSPLPWLALIGVGAILAVGGGVRLSRAGLRRRNSRG